MACEADNYFKFDCSGCLAAILDVGLTTQLDSRSPFQTIESPSLIGALGRSVGGGSFGMLGRFFVEQSFLFVLFELLAGQKKGEFSQ